MDTKVIQDYNIPKILIVDDDRVLADMLQKVFKKAGLVDVQTAYTGMDGLKLLNISEDKSVILPVPDFDIVILDIMLPDVRGFEICSKIKDAYANIQVMLISGYDIKEISAEILKCGADDFMTKPFNMVEMTTRLQILLSKNTTMMDFDTVMDLKVIDDSIKSEHAIPFIGDQVDEYVVIDSIGLGKTSVLYKVVDCNTQKICAMKMLTTHATKSPEVIKRFEYEIKIMSQVNHPNVIKYYAAGEHKGCLYLVMEFVNGINLEELLISKGHVDERLLMNIALGLAQALVEIHRQGVIHRDIKLKNSIYNPATNEIKLCDFGISQMPNPETLTKDGVVVGTPIYMAPESLRGEQANEQSDIYSFGATLYHLATSKPPFVAENHFELYNKHFNEKPKAIEEIRIGFSPKWSELFIDQCLAKELNDRPACIQEIVDSLNDLKKELNF